jgi:hemerythrin
LVDLFINTSLSEIPMPIVKWLPRYETGIPEIDRQHKQLFQAINDLGNAFYQGTAKAEAARVLDFLLSYTAVHFETEEIWMQAHGYPSIDLHVADHAELTDKVRDLNRRFVAGEQPIIEVAIFLADWLKHHIDTRDMDFIRHARGSIRP